MAATALLSMFISNTSTALIMVPIALAVVGAAGAREGDTEGFPGAVMMGIAFAASLGGLGTLVGSPTNAIAAGLIERTLGLHISFLDWAIYGVPVVLVSVPFAMIVPCARAAACRASVRRGARRRPRSATRQSGRPPSGASCPCFCSC